MVEGSRGSLHLGKRQWLGSWILGAIISVQVALSQNDLNRLICLLTCSQPAPSSVAPAARISGTALAPSHFPAAWVKGLVLCLKGTQPLLQPDIKGVLAGFHFPLEQNENACYSLCCEEFLLGAKNFPAA